MGTAPAESPHAVTTRVDPLSVAAKTLLAILINHPDFFHEVEEDIGSVDFREATLDRLRQEIIAMLSGSARMDPEAVKAALAARGLSPSVAALFRDDLIRTSAFVRVEASTAEIQSVWKECIRALKEAAARGEAPCHGLDADPSETDWQRWLARKRTMLRQDDD